MEKLVIDYLQRHFIIIIYENKNYSSRGLISEYFPVVSLYGKLIHWSDLSKQLITIFHINEDLAKFYVSLWGWENSHDLLKYWSLEINPFDDFVLPDLRNLRVYPATTIAMDLVPVQALSMPNLSLHLLDFKYGEPRPKNLKNKIIDVLFEIKEKISTFVNKVKIWKKS